MSEIKGVVVIVECDICKGAGWLKPHNFERDPDRELIKCGMCNGKKTVTEERSLKDLARALVVPLHHGPKP